MDHQTYSIVIASLQSAAVHIMTPEQYEVFTRSLRQMREDRLAPKDIISHLVSDLSDKVTAWKWEG
jgi:hypothetical protein